MNTQVSVVEPPAVSDQRRTLLLVEDRVGHYPEFRAFFDRTFDLSTIGLARPGYVTAPSGNLYELVFLGRSGEPFPSGLELYAITDALEAIEEEIVDRDIWAILRWMMAGVGKPWTVEDLDATGRLYRLPALNQT